MDLDTLIQRAKEKDPKALDIIYRTYYPLMIGICMNITREDRGTANDLVHDAFILAFVSIGSLRDNSKFSEWLTSIVKNVSLKHIEQRNRVHILPISSIKDEDAVFIDSSSSPDADLNCKELLELISLLPEGYSRILRLSVIEGFSHKEIAQMLGIEPHSSSSQLSRAKRLLKRMIDARMVGVIIILLIPLAWYIISHHGGEQPEKDVIVDIEQVEQPEPTISLPEQHESFEEKYVKKSSVLAREKVILADQTEDSVLAPDTDSMTVVPQKEMQMAESAPNSLDTNAKDSVIRTEIQPEINLAEGKSKKRKKWQLLAGGSLGPAVAESAYKLLAIDNSGLPKPDITSVELPDHVSTWEEYGRHLKSIPSPNISDDTLALIGIADHNSGEIKEREHHAKPITFGISLTKSLGRRWSLGTGLQYSLLRSQFAMGEDGYSIINKQKAHYLGIPLSVSYKWIDYKRLSAYSSVGVTLHIPVYGKVKSNYLLDWQTVYYSENRHFTPPLQWQTGISFGVQYMFAPHTSLFAEPTFNWFIPSGSETHTVWTEHPFMFTCPFGVRITW